MSYAPIVKIPVSYTDGTPLFSVDVPVHDLVDTAAMRFFPYWQQMVKEFVTQTKVETDAAKTSLYETAKSASVKVGIVVGVLAVGAGALYLYSRKK